MVYISQKTNYILFLSKMIEHIYWKFSYIPAKITFRRKNKTHMTWNTAGKYILWSTIVYIPNKIRYLNLFIQEFIMQGIRNEFQSNFLDSGYSRC